VVQAGCCDMDAGVWGPGAAAAAVDKGQGGGAEGAGAGSAAGEGGAQGHNQQVLPALHACMQGTIYEP
jgi:hypothetical protein